MFGLLDTAHSDSMVLGYKQPNLVLSLVREVPHTHAEMIPLGHKFAYSLNFTWNDAWTVVPLIRIPMVREVRLRVLVDTDRTPGRAYNRVRSGGPMTSKTKIFRLTFLFSFLYLFGAGFSTAELAKAQTQVPLDLTIQSCVDFSAAGYHLDAARHTVVKKYNAVPGKKEPIPQIESVETPEKVQEFMDWYANGGYTQMTLAGEACRAETLMKSGETAAWKAGFFIYGQEAVTAEFFADKLLRQCTGKSVK